MAALSAHQRRPLTLIAESDLNDPLLVTPREAGGYGLDAQWSDDFHHAAARRADRRDQRLLRRLRAALGAGEGLRARLLPRRHLLVVPRTATTASRSTPTRCRPGGSWCAARTTTRSATGPRRPAHRDPRRRPARLRGAAHAVRAVHADALPGRGVGGVDAVPVLHLAPRARAGQGHGRGPDRGVRADGLGPADRCPTRRTRRRSSARSWTGRSSRTAGTPDARDLPAAGRAAPVAPRADRPVVLVGVLHRRRGHPGVPAAARLGRDRGQLRRRSRRTSRRPASCCSPPATSSRSLPTGSACPRTRASCCAAERSGRLAGRLVEVDDLVVGRRLEVELLVEVRELDDPGLVALVDLELEDVVLAVRRRPRPSSGRRRRTRPR